MARKKIVKANQKGLFDHINAIFSNQSISYFDDLNEGDKKTFNTYIVNRGISMNHDYIELVNEIQKYLLPPRETYLFYSQILPKGKQYNRWVKSQKRTREYEEWIIDLVCKYYECSTVEAQSCLDIYYSSDKGREDLKSLLKKFGTSDKKLAKVNI